MRLVASLAPTTSWWWNDTLPPGSNRLVRGLPMSCNRAASRAIQVGPPEPILQVNGLIQHGQGVLIDVLVPVVLVALHAQRGQFGQHVISEPGGYQQIEPQPRVGRHDRLDHSSCTRSATRS